MRGRAIGLLAVLAAFCATVSVTWAWPDLMRQYRVLLTGAASISAMILLLIWLLLFSGMRWRQRIGAALCLAGAVTAFGSTFHVVGVTGDLVPIFAWRWSRATVPSASPGTSAFKGAAEARPADLSMISPSDYPQFLGPGRTAVVPDAHLSRDWKAHPPRLLWTRPVGAGWSSFAVANGHAVTQEQRGEDEAVTCYELMTGEPAWVYSYPAHFNETIGGEGPRATPTIAAGRVYAVGATGMLSCLDGATGKPLWMRDFVKENGGRVNEWGKTCSPLVLGEKVIVSAGGKDGKSLVAYDAATGELLWGGGSDRSGYSSPVFAELAGVPQVLIFNNNSVAAHSPADGSVLWRHAWQSEHPNVAQPLVIEGSKVLVSTGYGVGAELFEVAKEATGALSTAPVWKSRALKSKFSNILERHGHAYGLDDGIMTCIVLEDGRRVWKGGRYGHGELILADDLIIVQAESGEVALVEATPEEHRELGVIQALSDKTWNHPALAGGILLVRNHREAQAWQVVEQQ